MFVIEYTQEVFREYQPYVTKVDAYRKAQWACKYSGKGGLTFQEALQEEQKALAALAKVPAGLPPSRRHATPTPRVDACCVTVPI